MTERSRPDYLRELAVALAFALFVALLWGVTLGYPRSPEGWSQQILLRRGSLLDATAAHSEYPYFRPLWFFYLGICDRVDAAGGPSHLLLLVMHWATGLLGYALLRRAGFAWQAAAAVAGAALVSPGCVAAIAWLAAGNKVFVAFFATVAIVLWLRKQSLMSGFDALVFGVVPAIASSENAYSLVLVLPLCAFAARQRPLRIAAAFVTTLALACLHLFVLSPQREAGSDDRLAQLVDAISADPLAWCGEVAANLGRFFAHGIGLAEDAPLLGIALLATLTAWAIVARRRDLGIGLALYVCVNVPASCFVGESSRHHAYLPGLVAAAAVLVAFRPMLRTPRVALPFALGAVALLGLRAKAGLQPWADYLRHSGRILESCEAALHKAPKGPKLLWNVPEEYRAGLQLFAGQGEDVLEWPFVTVMSTRSEVLRAEPAVKLPKGIALEYDGQRIAVVDQAALAARRRAEQFGFVPEIVALQRPWLGFGEMLARDGGMYDRIPSFDPPDRRGTAADAAAAKAELHYHGAAREGGAGIEWELSVDAPGKAWLVLGWTPGSLLPTTENAWLFTLKPLPWAFRVEVKDASGKPVQVPTARAHGIYPALWCDAEKRRLRVFLRPR